MGRRAGRRSAYPLLLEGAFGSRFALTETLTRATPLILTGLAAAVAFRASFYNIGAEGQLYVGALAAVAVGGLTAKRARFVADAAVPAMVAAANAGRRAAAAGAARCSRPGWASTRSSRRCC